MEHVSNEVVLRKCEEKVNFSLESLKDSWTLVTSRGSGVRRHRVADLTSFCKHMAEQEVGMMFLKTYRKFWSFLIVRVLKGHGV